jgi:Leucine-rich repeat (LRR) protein
LYCHSNQLTSLDVSQNTALTFLGFYNNQLTSLDVSQNTALTLLQCGGNQLSSLDVQYNTALTYLDCQYNQLTNLNIQNGNNNNMPSSAFVVAPAITGTGTLTITSDSGGPITPNGLYNYTNVPPGTLWI